MITESLTALLSAHDLPEPAPPDPMPLFVGWFRDAEACGKYDDPNAMSLATGHGWRAGWLALLAVAVLLRPRRRAA